MAAYIDAVPERQAISLNAAGRASARHVVAPNVNYGEDVTYMNHF
ncbi:MAG: hypothetical protein ABWY18_15715 [Tardiphaga sp.]